MFTRAIEALHLMGAARRRALLVAAAAAIALSAAYLSTVTFDDDVAALLPDGGEAAARFELLRRAPFASTLTIHLYGENLSPEELESAADKVAAQLDPALFARVLAKAGGEVSGLETVHFLLDNLPRLFTEEDARHLSEKLSEAEVSEALRRSRAILLGPGGSALKGLVARDPLGFSALGGRKLEELNLFGKGYRGGRFMSESGESLLLFAETPISLTDGEGAARLEREFARVAGELPENVEADLIGAHRYTAANAGAIKSDLKVILTVASVGVLLLFALWLRGAGALLVWLLPLGGLAVAATLTSLIRGGLGGITLAFGGVLLGISVDYGLHTYYACKMTRGGDSAWSTRFRAKALGKVARPLGLAALTTLTGFAVLFTSRLPGQRELAVFAVIGVSLCLVGALVLLPHLLGNGKKGGATPGGPAIALAGGSAAGRVATLLWCLLILAGGWYGTGVRFEGELRKVGMRPPELIEAEAELTKHWGGLRSRAVAWAQGEEVDGALARAEEALEKIQENSGKQKPVTLVGLLPSLETQGENLARWTKFWTPEKIASLKSSLADASAAAGFATTAFTPFLDSLTREPLPITAESLRGAGLGKALELLLVEDGEGAATLLIAPDEGVLDPADAVEGVMVVSPRALSQLLGETIKGDFTRFILLALASIGVMTALLLRRPALVAAALAPVAGGLAALCVAAGVLGWEFDLFNIISSILIIGLGVDYGIFMAHGAERGTTERVVFVSGATTLVGVGSLALATHPALHSIGMTVLVGVAAAMLTALWVTPILAGLAGRGGER